MKTILSTSVDGLKKDQYEYLKQFAISRIQEVINLLKNDRYTDAVKMLDLDKSIFGYSPSGDCMGSDNYYISFEDCGDKSIQDIGDVFEKLRELKM